MQGLEILLPGFCMMKGVVVQPALHWACGYGQRSKSEGQPGNQGPFQWSLGRGLGGMFVHMVLGLEG